MIPLLPALYKSDASKLEIYIFLPARMGGLSFHNHIALCDADFDCLHNWSVCCFCHNFDDFFKFN